jgi:hypothetical protein
MPGEHRYRRLRAGQRQIHEPQVNDVQRDLEALMNSQLAGGEIIKDPGGWFWIPGTASEWTMARTTAPITAWSPTTLIVGQGTAQLPVFDSVALTLDYAGETVDVYNEGPDGVDVDRVIVMMKKYGLWWMVSGWCSSALP